MDVIGVETWCVLGLCAVIELTLLIVTLPTRLSPLNECILPTLLTLPIFPGNKYGQLCRGNHDTPTSEELREPVQLKLPAGTFLFPSS
jgi:hypothetical protein